MCVCVCVCVCVCIYAYIMFVVYQSNPVNYHKAHLISAPQGDVFGLVLL